jgi:protein-tyrosine phosphatase
MHTSLYRIDGPWPGRLAMAARPRGGDWLDDEIGAWRRAGVDVLVCLLTADEMADLELAGEAAACLASGIDFLPFPFADRSVPASRDSFAALIQTVSAQLADGKNVVVHCRQGIGRAALVAISALVTAGIGLDEAIRRVSDARGRPVPETDEQRRWLIAFVASAV